jgi:hypothetical protein
MHGRGNVADVRITELEPADEKEPGVEQIFQTISSDRMKAARQTLTYSRSVQSPDDFMQQARVLVFLKGRDSHDYKFSSAVLEDYYHLSPAWRDRFLAASVFNLRGSGGNDNPVAERAKKALA